MTDPVRLEIATAVLAAMPLMAFCRGQMSESERRFAERVCADRARDAVMYADALLAELDTIPVARGIPREPTEAMLDALTDRMWVDHTAGGVWRAMWDAATRA